MWNHMVSIYNDFITETLYETHLAMNTKTHLTHILLVDRPEILFMS